MSRGLCLKTQNWYGFKLTPIVKTSLFNEYTLNHSLHKESPNVRKGS